MAADACSPRWRPRLWHAAAVLAAFFVGVSGNVFAKDADVPKEIARHLSEDEFWWLIEITREQSHGSQERQLLALRKALRDRTPDEIEAFQWHFMRLRYKACTWDLWGVVYVINGGCGDDSFLDFRYWLISRGKTIYESCLKDPQRLAEVPNVKNCFFEEFGYAADRVYESKFGKPLTIDVPATGSEEPSGVPFKDDPEELKKRFPKAWKRFGE
ncbi:MAG: DUF4240 domain-containing protein [Candidatus Nealsonbacteria bacterium]|nr:DUF4240 domain-containing protein [Candidatus Nealsonbacteria bacterium]